MREDEERTILRDEIVVSKCDPRIEFRGQIDSLYAHALLNCAYAEHYGYTNVTLGAKDIARVVREISRAEALAEEPDINTIMGMTLEELREVSYHPKSEIGLDPYIPDDHIDLMTAHLNVLRAEIRQVERTCCCLEDRSKAIKATRLILNRLSSAAYILMLECRSERP